MSTLTAALIVAGVTAAGLLLLALGLCRAAGRGSRAEETREELVHDVGPDSLRLLQDLDAHLDEYVAADDELAAGFDQLRQAIRDEQQKGD